MNEDLENLEEKYKQRERSKKEHKQSGRSVFKLQEIIKNKSKKVEDISQTNSKNTTSS